MPRPVYCPRDFERLFRRTRASPMIADIQVDQHVDGPAGFCSGLFVPLGLSNMIHHDHRAGLDDSGDLQRIGDGRRQQQARDPGLRHQLGFGQRRHRNAGRPCANLAFGDLDTLVRLGVRAKLLAGLLYPLGHPRQVGLQCIEIHQKRRRRNLVFREHRSIIASCSLFSALVFSGGVGLCCNSIRTRCGASADCGERHFDGDARVPGAR